MLLQKKRNQIDFLGCKRGTLLRRCVQFEVLLQSPWGSHWRGQTLSADDFDPCRFHQHIIMRLLYWKTLKVNTARQASHKNLHGPSQESFFEPSQRVRMWLPTHSARTLDLTSEYAANKSSKLANPVTRTTCQRL